MLGGRFRRTRASAEAPPPESARDTVRVSRARVLDGAHLWLTLAAPYAGTVVARDGDGREGAFSAPVATGLQTVCLDLAELPGSAAGPGAADAPAAAFELLLADGDRRWSLVLADDHEPPTRAPESPDGRWRYRVVAQHEGLVLRRRPAPPTIPVTRVGVCPEGLEVCWPASSASDLLLLDPDGATVAVVPATAEAGVARAVITPETPLTERVTAATGPADSPVPLVRRSNDLRRPNRAVAMPSLALGEGSLELLWHADGRLQVRRKEVAR